MKDAWWIMRSLLGCLWISNPKKSEGLTFVKFYLRNLPDILESCREACPHGAVLTEKKEIIDGAGQEAQS